MLAACLVRRGPIGEDNRGWEKEWTGVRETPTDTCGFAADHQDHTVIKTVTYPRWHPRGWTAGHKTGRTWVASVRIGEAS